MIFVQFWWALLVFNSPGFSSEATDGENKVSEQLQSFSLAVEKAGPELQELWSSFGAMQDMENLKEQPRERRNTLDDMLASFAQAPIEASKVEAEKDVLAWQEEADAWYRDFQAKNLNSQKRTGAGKQEKRSPVKEKAKETIEPHDKAIQRSETAKAMPKYKEMSDDASLQKHEAAASAKDSPVHLDSKPQTLAEHESSEVKAVNDPPKKAEGGTGGDASVADGAYESTLNRLSFHHDESKKLDHEANYKLSKIEQEASEKIPKFPRSGSQEKESFKPKKRSYTGGFNPMDEIKLKTSCRMIAKGFGPLLPSETYDISRRRKLEDWEPQELESGHDNHRMNMKHFEPQTDNFDYSLYTKGTSSDSDRLMDQPQSFDFKTPQYDRFYNLNRRDRLNVLDYEKNNRIPIDLDGYKREPGMGTSSHGNQYKHGPASSSIETVAEPAMKATALKAKIKSRLVRSPLEGEEDQKAPEHKLEAKEKEAKLEESHEYRKFDADLMAKAESFFERETAANAVRDQEKLKNDHVAAAPPATNIDAEAGSKLDTGGGRSARRTRRVKRSLEEYQPEQQQEHVAKRKAQLLDDFEDHNGNRASFGVLGNGLLTPDAEELGGKSLSLPTHYNDSLKDIYSATKYQPSFHKTNFKNHFNLSPLHEHQKVKPIQHGARRATYIYDLIAQSAEDQLKYFKERQNSLRVLGEVFRKDTHLLDPSKINEKTRLVKKLLGQYKGLPLKDQLAATDMLLLDLDYLRKMAGTAVRSQRNALLFEVMKQKDLNEALEEVTSKYHSRFIKLLKTAELFQQMGEEEVWNSLML